MDQSGPVGSYSPFQFYQNIFATLSPVKFDLFTPVNLTGANFNISSVNSVINRTTSGFAPDSVVLNGIHKSSMVLLDWQTGLATNFDNKQTTGLITHWYYVRKR